MKFTRWLIKPKVSYFGVFIIANAIGAVHVRAYVVAALVILSGALIQSVLEVAEEEHHE